MFEKHLSVGLVSLTVLVSGSLAGQTSVSKAWVADNRDGTYRNPILHADYSDPDVVRVGDDFYLVASSFNAAPGLPIHAKVGSSQWAKGLLQKWVTPIMTGSELNDHFMFSSREFNLA
jgi:hypothetical protein